MLCMLPSFIDMFRMSNDIPYSMPIVNYFVGYETGFGGRKLIGTLMRFILPDYVELRHLRLVIIAVNAFMSALFVWFVWKTLKKSRNNVWGVLMILALYMLSPFSILRWMSSGLSVSFMETYMIVFTLIWLLLYERCHNTWFYYAATFIIAILCCLIHHTFCCTLFPIFVAVFVYDIFDRGFSPQKLIIYSAICFSTAALLAVLWKFSTMNVDIETLSHNISNRTSPNVFSIENDSSSLQLLYYLTNSENTAQAFLHTPWRFQELIITIVLLSPVFYLFYAPWMIAFGKSKGQTDRYKYLLPPIVLTILTLPIFFLATDYSRWFVAWFFGLFAIAWVVLHQKDRVFSKSIEQLFSHPWIVICVIIYASQLHMAWFAGLQEAIAIRPHLFP